MVDISIVLDALGVLCNADVTSIQKQRSQPGERCFQGPQQQLSIKQLVLAVLDADETCPRNFHSIQCLLDANSPTGCLHNGQAGCLVNALARGLHQAPAGVLPVQAPLAVGKKNFFIDEEEFFEPRFDFDFRKKTDCKTFYRGGEKYDRPCGWYRFGLKVLDKYGENAWLGTTSRCTKSCPGEWPVSFHGTSKKGAEGIIGGHYKPGPGQRYGRGIYSSPYMSEVFNYAKTFTCSKNGKKYKVVLQNRINPEYRQKFYNDKYWLIPIAQGSSDEQEMVDRAIRPYGLLLKEI